MSEQPNALRLAKWLDAMPSSGYALTNQAAAELRRLHTLSAELLRIAERLVCDGLSTSLVKDARAAIAKGEQV